MLIDVTERFGTAGLVQCDLGERVHRNRSLAELGVQALAILQLALVRAGLCEANAAAFGWTTHLVRPAAEPCPSPWSSDLRWPRCPAHRKTA